MKIPSYSKFIDEIKSHASEDKTKAYSFSYYECDYFGCKVDNYMFYGNVWNTLLKFQEIVSKTTTTSKGTPINFLLSQYEMSIDMDDFDREADMAIIGKFIDSSCVENKDMKKFMEIFIENLVDNDTLWLVAREIVN